VSPFFENLPSQTENPDYYKQIRLPLSLGIIERKLKDKEYHNLSSLESDFKRLVSNAKETNDRSSTIFGDAERVRKAVSNLMVKHNPAYKSGNYQAVPTPLPPSPGSGEEANGDDNADESAGDQLPKDHEAKSTPHNDVDEAEAEEEDIKGTTEDEQEEEGQLSEAEKDGDEEDEEDEDNEEEQEDGDEEEADPHPRRRRVSTTLRSEPEQSRDSTTPARRTVQRPGKSDHHYENVPFTGLSFQEAQEKVIEELIRHKEDS